MAGNKIKFQVFLSSDEAIKIKAIADRLASGGLDGSMSSAIRMMVAKGLNSSDFHTLENLWQS